MGSRIITITVSQEAGVGHLRNVQEAVDAVPYNNTIRTVIQVMPGVYRQPVFVPKNKNKITLAGLVHEKTVLTFDNTAGKIGARPPSHVNDVIGTGLFACGTVIVEGEDFMAENITSENSAPKPPQQDTKGQGVALRVSAYRCAFYNCKFLGWQDTLYLQSGRQYLRDCYIEGSVDFICGHSTALFENCHIHCKSEGFITAQEQSDDPPHQNTGYVFLRCVITGNGSGTSYTYLGRPWQAFATVVFAYSYMDTCVKPEGWSNWSKETTQYEKKVCFREYKCFGPGSSKSNRGWGKQLEDNKAEQLLADGFEDPDWQWPSLRTGSL